MNPLKFRPIISPKVWGYESWLISGYGNQVSVVDTGALADNDLNDLVEIYMDELVGEKVYNRFGTYFPLLIKIIHAQDDLSIQVHPNDREAEPMGELGKEEMWYVMDTTPDAKVVSGFTKDTSSEEVTQRLEDGSITDILHYTTVSPGDVVTIPAGRVHALCKGTMVVEIQESSDLTYRLYDYQRPDKNGQLRPLHIQEALKVLTYGATKNPITHPDSTPDTAVPIADTEHFTVNLIRLTSPMVRDCSLLDSFVIYICTHGSAAICVTDADDSTPIQIEKGEAVLVPASLDDVRLIPTSKEACFIETFLGRN